MTQQEFFEWLDTCPTHKWDITMDEDGFITVSFRYVEEEEDE